MDARRFTRAAGLLLGGFGLIAWTRGPGAPGQGARDRSSFDLAVDKVDVRQISSTPMFREVEILCVVTNRGPKASTGPVTLVISRPGDDGPKILKKITLPEALAPGGQFETRAEGASWFATPIPYRCEIQFGSSTQGDADPNDDHAEFTYPKL